MLTIEDRAHPGYERVVVGRDDTAGLHAVIAVHSTKLGPSLGGVRMHAYRSVDDAVGDALRLASAMSLKAAMADLPLGGGKAVVIGDPHRDKSRDLFLALGELIETLGGAYIAAEDIGLFAEDLDIAAERTRHLTGASVEKGGSGDCSGATAIGIVLGIEAAIAHRLGIRSLGDVSVAIQGMGKVGRCVAEMLHERGARLVVSDVVSGPCEEARERFGAEIVAPDQIHAAAVDVFCPCAMGAVLDETTIPRLRAAIVAGGANNQLADEARDSIALHRRSILHAPDYVINAGGLIRLFAMEIAGETDPMPRLAAIPGRLRTLFEASAAADRPPMLVANDQAMQRLGLS